MSCLLTDSSRQVVPSGDLGLRGGVATLGAGDSLAERLPLF